MVSLDLELHRETSAADDWDESISFVCHFNMILKFFHWMSNCVFRRGRKINRSICFVAKQRRIRRNQSAQWNWHLAFGGSLAYRELRERKIVYLFVRHNWSDNYDFKWKINKARSIFGALESILSVTSECGRYIRWMDGGNPGENMIW